MAAEDISKTLHDLLMFRANALIAILENNPTEADKSDALTEIGGIVTNQALSKEEIDDILSRASLFPKTRHEFLEGFLADITSGTLSIESSKEAYEAVETLNEALMDPHFSIDYKREALRIFPSYLPKNGNYEGYRSKLEDTFSRAARGEFNDKLGEIPGDIVPPAPKKPEASVPPAEAPSAQGSVPPAGPDQPKSEEPADTATKVAPSPEADFLGALMGSTDGVYDASENIEDTVPVAPATKPSGIGPKHFQLWVDFLNTSPKIDSDVAHYRMFREAQKYLSSSVTDPETRAEGMRQLQATDFGVRISLAYITFHGLQKQADAEDLARGTAGIGPNPKLFQTWINFLNTSPEINSDVAHYRMFREAQKYLEWYVPDEKMKAEATRQLYATDFGTRASSDYINCLQKQADAEDLARANAAKAPAAAEDPAPTGDPAPQNPIVCSVAPKATSSWLGRAWNKLFFKKEGTSFASTLRRRAAKLLLTVGILGAGVFGIKSCSSSHSVPTKAAAPTAAPVTAPAAAPATASATPVEAGAPVESVSQTSFNGQTIYTLNSDVSWDALTRGTIFNPAPVVHTRPVFMPSAPQIDTNLASSAMVTLPQTDAQATAEEPATAPAPVATPESTPEAESTTTVPETSATEIDPAKIMRDPCALPETSLECNWVEAWRIQREVKADTGINLPGTDVYRMSGETWDVQNAQICLVKAVQSGHLHLTIDPAEAADKGYIAACENAVFHAAHDRLIKQGNRPELVDQWVGHLEDIYYGTNRPEGVEPNPAALSYAAQVAFDRSTGASSYGQYLAGTNSELGEIAREMKQASCGNIDLPFRPVGKRALDGIKQATCWLGHKTHITSPYREPLREMPPLGTAR